MNFVLYAVKYCPFLKYDLKHPVCYFDPPFFQASVSVTVFQLRLYLVTYQFISFWQYKL
jgi:hypothetical protein